MSTTLILGGGFGGISTAVQLRKSAPKGHRIVLIDKNGEFAFGAVKPWIFLGEMSVRDAIHPLWNLEKHDIEVVRAEVQSIDPVGRKVSTTKGEYQGDFLVIALGANYDMSVIPGLEGAAQTYYTLPGAVRLKPVLESFTEGKVVHLIPRGPFKCPPAPYEGAFVIHDFFRKKDRLGKVTESLFTVEGAPMATAGPPIGAFVKEELAKRKIEYHTLKKTTKVDSAGKVIHFEDGSSAPYDLLIAVPPHVAPKVVRESGLLGPGGWIPVDSKTLAVKDRECVFAIGDVSVVSLPGRFKPDAPLVLPKAGVFADAEGKVVASNIAAELAGRSGSKSFEGKGFCYIEMGDLHAIRGDGNFFDMPNPTMARKVPDMQQYQDKKRWISGWLKQHWLV
jgi:sulfide:quinone oxidoreductase